MRELSLHRRKNSGLRVSIGCSSKIGGVGEREGKQAPVRRSAFPAFRTPRTVLDEFWYRFESKARQFSCGGGVLKRTLDISLASLMLITVLPLLAAAAVAIKLDSEGPVLFLQERMGRRFKRFKIWKLRTMHVCSQGPAFTLCEDPRITGTGRWLRRLKIDELPQLWNVVRGQMSLVGPRPMIPELVLRYRRDYWRLLDVRPGLMDPATLKYCREEVSLVLVADPQRYLRNVLMPDKVRLSKAYLDRANFWSDLGVLTATCIALLASRPRPGWRSAAEPEANAPEFNLSEPMQVIDAQSSIEGF
jgi:lipopolysaccharide/colanic/teichoic acid biosynthesis glycosyltransferase